ncbi:MAG TPA: lycopene cyclase domain-containing protein [Kaistiaceae bacterium]|nr:lycopene cyclase domain-containing protein [Kaistiaceae bacterium]
MHHYLVSELFGLPVTALAFLLAGRQRRAMSLAALGFVVMSPLAVTFNDRYWSPDRVFGGAFGIEDLIFCVSVGSVVWLVAVWPYRWRLELPAIDPRAVAGRALPIMAFGFAVLGAALLAGTGIAVASTAAQFAAAAVVLFLRPRLLELALRATVVYVPYYLAHIAVMAAWRPAILDLWNGPEILGIRFFGLPIEEPLWMISLTMMYPAFVAYILGVVLPHPQHAAKDCADDR